MNSARDDEEMENDIQEFMSIILAEEDEWEYTDYRRYFSYDMEISSRQGQTEITAELSKTGFRQQRREADPVFHHSGGESFAVLPGKHLLRPSGIHRRGILGIVERADRADGALFRRKSLPGILCSPAREDQQYRSVHRFNRQPDRDRTVYECGRRIGGSRHRKRGEKMADRKEWKEQLLSKLLDQYEKASPTPVKTKVKQVFSVKPSDIFKGYNKDFLPPEQLFQEKEFERLIRQMESEGLIRSSSEYGYSPSDLCCPGTLGRLLCLPEPDRKEYSKNGWKRFIIASANAIYWRHVEKKSFRH